MSEAGTNASGRRRAGSFLLVASLCLNVALAAMLIAVFVNFLPGGHRPPGLLTPQALMLEAAPAERARIQSIIGAHAGKLERLRRDDFLARQEAFGVFSSADFTPALFSKALSDAREADDALRTEQAEVLAESAAQLSPAERQAEASSVRGRMQWWHFFHRRHDRE